MFTNRWAIINPQGIVTNVIVLEGMNYCRAHPKPSHPSCTCGHELRGHKLRFDKKTRLDYFGACRECSNCREAVMGDVGCLKWHVEDALGKAGGGPGCYAMPGTAADIGDRYDRATKTYLCHDCDAPVDVFTYCYGCDRFMALSQKTHAVDAICNCGEWLRVTRGHRPKITATGLRFAPATCGASELVASVVREAEAILAGRD